MRTEEYFITNNNLEKIQCSNLSQKELQIIEEYVEFTRHIQEINQLFNIFTTSKRQMFLNYNFNVDDTFSRKIDMKNKQDDGIIINTLVINYISSAKTFIESIENFIKQKKGEKEKEKFKIDTINRIYDECFSYRCHTNAVVKLFFY